MNNEHDCRNKKCDLKIEMITWRDLNFVYRKYAEKNLVYKLYQFSKRTSPMGIINFKFINEVMIFCLII